MLSASNGVDHLIQQQ